MDKWKLLKKALQKQNEEIDDGEEQEESSSFSSLHFSLLRKEKVSFQWEERVAISSTTTEEEVHHHCRCCALRRDTSQMTVTLFTNSMENSDNDKSDVNFHEDKEVNETNESDIEMARQNFYRIVKALKATEKFQMLAHPKNDMSTTEQLESTCEINEGIDEVDFLWKDASVSPFLPRCEFFKWTLPSEQVIYSREKAKNSGVSITELLSHKLYGVDNTGNVRVWAAESMLLYFILTKYHSEFQNKSILELGGGLSAVCGLGLAASVDNCQVFVTDGHPECVANQKVCREMNSHLTQKSNSYISCHRLRWSKGDKYGELNDIFEMKMRMSSEGCNEKFDRIVAADCLFFRDFHDDLVWLIKESLAPNGVAFFLQPPRGGTMEEFIGKAEEHFSVELRRNYDERITELHNENMNQSQHGFGNYNSDIHYPLLLMLTHPS